MLEEQLLDARRHDRRAFRCGAPALDDYLHKYAAQQNAKGISTVYVVVDDAAPSRILGFYTLSAARWTCSSSVMRIARSCPATQSRVFGWAVWLAIAHRRAPAWRGSDWLCSRPLPARPQPRGCLCAPGGCQRRQSEGFLSAVRLQLLRGCSSDPLSTLGSIRRRGPLGCAFGAVGETMMPVSSASCRHSCTQTPPQTALRAA